MNYFTRLVQIDFEDPGQCALHDGRTAGSKSDAYLRDGITSMVYDEESGNVVARVRHGKLEADARSIYEVAPKK